MFLRWSKKKKEEEKMTTDEREIKKAEERIKERGADSQTERGREDESVAAQERASGNENSQTANERISESEGTRRYDEERAYRERLESKLDKLIELFTARAEEKADRDADALDRAKEKYGVGEAVFEAAKEAERMSAAEAAEILRKIKP